MSMKERDRERFAARQAEQAAARRPERPARRHVASKADQHARYIDCGPQAWDDTGRGDYTD